MRTRTDIPVEVLSEFLFRTLTEHPLRGGELLLLCSDGVHSVLDDDSLHTLLVPDRSLEEMARAIVTAAIERGSRDHVTALVVRYSDESPGG